jgi:hypothetical protein
MADLGRIRDAARQWLAYIGDVDSSPVIVPFSDPNGEEQAARYRLAKVLRDELFEPERYGPIYCWSGETPLRGQIQHWGGSDIWRCDEHPDWEGEEFGSWATYWEFVSTDKRQATRLEADVRREWENESMEAHAAHHGVEVGESTDRSA